MVTDVAIEWAPRITMPASVSFTHARVQERLRCWWAGVVRSIWGGTIA